ncbi:uncharacterized protein LOC143291421 [Babylonia areolata]|uniref:uncharacterized protein LOC143291421 n=1 Tax=Babylonia areolata TaxID=304850 RepID=UPI003FD0D95C
MAQQHVYFQPSEYGYHGYYPQAQNQMSSMVEEKQTQQCHYNNGWMFDQDGNIPWSALSISEKWRHMGIAFHNPVLASSSQRDTSGGPSGLQSASWHQDDTLQASADLQMMAHQQGCATPRPAGPQVPSYFQTASPVLSAAQPARLSANYCVPGADNTYEGLGSAYYSRQNLVQSAVQMPYQRYTVGQTEFTSSAAQSTSTFGNVPQLPSNRDDSYCGSRFSDRSCTMQLPSYNQTFNHLNHNWTSNQICAGQQIKAINQQSVYPTHNTSYPPSAEHQTSACLSASSRLGYQHPGSGSFAGYTHGPTSTSGVLKEFNSDSPVTGKRSTRKKETSKVHQKKNVDHRNGSAKAPGSEVAEPNQQPISNNTDSGKQLTPYPVLLVSAHSNESGRSMSVWNETNQGVDLVQNTKHSEKQQKCCNTSCQSIISQNELCESGQTVSNSRSEQTASDSQSQKDEILPKLLSSSESLQSRAERLLTIEEGPHVSPVPPDANNLSNHRSQHQPVTPLPNICQCTRNPLSCDLHNPLRSPVDQTGNEHVATSGSENRVAPLQQEQNEKVPEDCTASELLERHIDKVKNMYLSSAQQDLDIGNGQQVPGVKTSTVSDSQVNSAAKHLHMVTRSPTCSRSFVSHGTVECHHGAVSPSTEPRSGSDTADLAEEVDIYDHTCMVCFKTFQNRSEVNDHLSLHLKDNAEDLEEENDDFVQDTNSVEQICSVSLTSDSHALLSASSLSTTAHVRSGQDRKQNNVEKSRCVCDQPANAYSQFGAKGSLQSPMLSQSAASAETYQMTRSSENEKIDSVSDTSHVKQTCIDKIEKCTKFCQNCVQNDGGNGCSCKMPVASKMPDDADGSVSVSANSGKASTENSPLTDSGKHMIDACHSQYVGKESSVVSKDDILAVATQIRHSHHRDKTNMKQASDLCARRESFESSKKAVKSVNMKRENADVSDHAASKIRKHPNDSYAKHEKEHDAGDLKKTAGSKLCELLTSSKTSHFQPADMKGVGKCHSLTAKHKKETSKQACSVSSQIHSKNLSSLESTQNGRFADSHPENSTSSNLDEEQMLSTSDVSHPLDSLNSGTESFCPEPGMDKTLKTSSHTPTVKFSNSRGSSKVDGKETVDEQHVSKVEKQRSESVHMSNCNTFKKLKMEKSASATDSLAERNHEAKRSCSTGVQNSSGVSSSGMKGRVLQTESKRTMSANSSESLKTAKAQKIVSRLRSIFKNNEELVYDRNCEAAEELTNGTSEQGIETDLSRTEVCFTKEKAQVSRENSMCCAEERRKAAADIGLETVASDLPTGGRSSSSGGSRRPSCVHRAPGEKKSHQEDDNCVCDITFCVKCMTVFVKRSAYDGHGCCQRVEAVTPDRKGDVQKGVTPAEKGQKGVTPAEKGQKGVTPAEKGRDQRTKEKRVNHDTDFVERGGTKRRKHSQRNSDADSGLSDVCDGVGGCDPQRSNSGAKGTVVKVPVVKVPVMKVPETHKKKKRKRIWSYHRKKEKQLKSRNPRDTKKNSERCIQMFKCDHCEQTYSSRGGLLFHWQTVHKKSGRAQACRS